MQPLAWLFLALVPSGALWGYLKACSKCRLYRRPVRWSDRIGGAFGGALAGLMFYTVAGAMYVLFAYAAGYYPR